MCKDGKCGTTTEQHSIGNDPSRVIIDDLQTYSDVNVDEINAAIKRFRKDKPYRYPPKVG